MTTYRFAITELRHHDFANRLEELYDKAMGKRMSYKDSFFECYNQANILTTYFHFLTLCIDKKSYISDIIRAKRMSIASVTVDS